MSASSSPLANLVQAIHLPSHRFILTTTAPAKASEASSSKIGLHLFAHTPLGDSEASGSSSQPRVIVWQGEVDLSNEEMEQEVLADALKKGFLHVDMPMTNRKALSKAEAVHLKILPPDRDPFTFKLVASASPADAIPHLLDSTFDLLSRPTAAPDKSENRALRSQMSQKDAEIAALSTKLASAKATVVRATAADNNHKKIMLSPQKKAPANASTLQPNAKRRKVAEDEFAGSDED